MIHTSTDDNAYMNSILLIEVNRDKYNSPDIWNPYFDFSLTIISLFHMHFAVLNSIHIQILSTR